MYSGKIAVPPGGGGILNLPRRFIRYLDAWRQTADVTNKYKKS
jgi:hypothetical protein